MKGYKVFEPDWTCRGFQFEVGKTYEEDVTPSCCIAGFHFCTDLVDCFRYYSFNPANKVAEIEALGVIDGNLVDSKHCTNRIQIVRELTWEEVLKMVNSGNGNSGNRNSGDRNSGNGNSGNWNSGDWNSGNRNSGNRNSGNRNSGYGNSGDWNITSFSSGCFNTQLLKIVIFNKPSEWTLDDWRKSEARSILSSLGDNATMWVRSDEMTEEEKTEHPDHKVVGGYLKVVDQTENNQAWWDDLPKEDQDIVKSIPNFDAEIFKKITGIRV